MSTEKPTENLANVDATTLQDVSEMSAEIAIEHAKRAFALKKYEHSVEYYARALEVVTDQVGEDSPQVADLYFSYGKALLENAISQNAVLGKEQQQEEVGQQEENKASNSTNGPILSFSGDVEDAPEEDPAVDLLAQSADAERADEGEEEEDGEPEDDFNAAWEVFEMARSIYEKQKILGSSDDVSLKLADTYIALGDVSLETEKFDQAITDYESALSLKEDLLPFSSRQIAEAHYKLCIVLDLTSGRLADAIIHAQQALESIQSRLNELKAAQSNLKPTPGLKSTTKGKGKGKAESNESIHNLTPAQIEGEVKELTGLQEDLALKVEELKTSPNDSVDESAPALAAKALDKELNAGSSSTGITVINDLTKIVRKKKNPASSAESSKRKAEDDGEVSGSEKKPKLDNN
ncbi:hypothetical protein E1B28_007589 [Marasmius oreades]|uniref:Tetratricopeptide SHNi-TPR domain-containing protein n=1 Tax=Marasmius oreades TaxID=181124 RepID=A0A9P7S1Y4_9AGAR|nr:uncharacterized protein E1B28_007589 [Marasmius oreades]KAG7093956.1 hypothetical protein E1B28_007589 [Marasmius oreades]